MSWKLLIAIFEFSILFYVYINNETHFKTLIFSKMLNIQIFLWFSIFPIYRCYTIKTIFSIYGHKREFVIIKAFEIAKIHRYRFFTMINPKIIIKFFQLTPNVDFPLSHSHLRMWKRERNSRQGWVFEKILENMYV